MISVVFIVAAVFILLAIIFFVRRLAELYRDGRKARGLLSTGFLIGIWGVVVATILYGFFNL